MDHVPKEVRSKIMAAVRSRATVQRSAYWAKYSGPRTLEVIENIGMSSVNQTLPGPVEKWRCLSTGASGTAASANIYHAQILPFGVTKLRPTDGGTGASRDVFGAPAGKWSESKSATFRERQRWHAS